MVGGGGGKNRTDLLVGCRTNANFAGHQKKQLRKQKEPFAIAPSCYILIHLAKTFLSRRQEERLLLAS